MSKKWVLCIACPHIDKCKAGIARTQNITTQASKEIGCFDFEMYKKQIEDKQLKLF